MPKGDAFFRVELPILKLAHVLGSRPLGAYLIAACGTGADHQTTRWSANAVGKYGGCRDRAAREAIATLKAADLMRQTQGGQRPIYKLPTLRELRLMQAEREGAKLRIELLTSSEPELDLKGRRKAEALELTKDGLFQETGPGRFERRDPPQCWLPSSLVFGAGGEMPPVKRLMMNDAGDQLFLLSALYCYQNLPEFGGVDPSILWKSYTAELIHEVGGYRVWEFAPRLRYIDPANDPAGLIRHLTGLGDEPYRRFWDALNGLSNGCLIDKIPTLFAGDPASAPVMHPLEGDLGEAADAAARAMLFESRTRHASGLLVPVPKCIDAPQVADVYRLRYRPHTDMTKAWIAQERENRPKWIRKYYELEISGEDEIAEMWLRQRREDIKV